MSGAWRQEWAQSIRKATGLSLTTRMVAQVLALDYANRDTGQCNPSRRTLADHLDVSEATIKRALAELTRAGWLGRTDGTARGRTVSYTFLAPGKVVAFSAKQKSDAGHARPAIVDGTRVKSARNAGQICTSPYKGRNQVKNHGARRDQSCAYPVDQACLIKAGSHRETAWNEWLAANGWPCLTDVGFQEQGMDSQSFLMPFAFPPADGDETGLRIVQRFLDWSTSRSSDQRERMA